MIQIGKFNTLTVIEETDYGYYLDGGDDGDILLPNRYVPDDCQVGDQVEAFVCYDSEDRLIAVRENPLVQVGQLAVLKVVSLTEVGAFLNWGLSKDLFLPFREQTKDLQVGQDVVIFAYLDKTLRISASMRIEKHIEKTPIDYKPEQAVQLIIVGRTQLGYKALINEKHFGILYENEVFQELKDGQKLPGFVKKVREDGKIDLILQAVGYKAAADIGQKILELLQTKNGFLAINDKTSAETIYDLFGVSKKKYKIALGGLYKQRLISVDDDGIRLVR